MATRSLEYTSQNRLSCTGCSPAEVILCVKSELVALPNCPTYNHAIPSDPTSLSAQAGIDRPSLGFIYATLVNYVRFNGQCGGSFYRYIFEYDDAQLVTPAKGIDCRDVMGVVCEGCLTEWVRSIVGQDVIVEERTQGYITIRNQRGCEFTFRRGWTRLVQDVNTGDVTITYPDGSTDVIQIPTCVSIRQCFSGVDTNTIDYTYNSATGQHSADVKISAQPGNDLQALADGLFVDFSAACPEIRQCFSGTDTNTIDYTYNPLTGDHSADVKISAQPGNDLQALADGLFVDIGAACPEIRQCFSGTDTNTIDYTYNPLTGDHSADVKISAQPGNDLQALADGLFVDISATCPEIRQCFSGSDTNTIDYTYNPLTGDHSADVKISAQPGNDLQALADGLFVDISATCPEIRQCFSGTDTNTIHYTYNPVTGDHSADVKISAQAGNDLQALADGLFVDIGAACPEIRQCFSGVNTTSVQYNYNSGTGQHSANVIIDPAVGNQLTLTPNGLFVPPAAPLPTDSLVNNGNNSFTHTAVNGAVTTIPFGHTLSNPSGAIIRLTQPNGTVNDVDVCSIVAANCPAPTETPNSATDTNSIDLTLSGPFNRHIQADVKISSAAGNQVSVLGDGLFVPAPPPVPSDSLVDNGNRTFTHTAVNGVVTTFCQGIQNLDTGGTCAVGSVGPGWMVRNAQFTGPCTLQITGAPEHTTLGSVTPFGINVPINDRDAYFFDPVIGTGVSFSGPANQVFFIPENGVGVITPGCQQIPLVITNPNPCRNLLVTGIIEIRVTWNVRGNAAGTFYTSMFTFGISLDGAAYVDVKTYPFRNFEGEAGASGVMSRIQTFMTFQKIIPPGGNLVVRSRVRVDVSGHSAFAGAGNPASTEVTGTSIRGHWWGSTL